MSDLGSFRVDACQVGTFLQVAMPTGQRKVVQLRRSTMLLGNDMFQVK
jgi:hypothetical protein